MCHGLETSANEKEWRDTLTDLTAIVKLRPREIRGQCIAISMVCTRALELFKDDETIRRKAVICLCELAYDEIIVQIWSINGAEVESLISSLEARNEAISSVAMEALARWVTPFPERVDSLVQLLISRLCGGPRQSTKAMRSVVHLCTEILGGEDRMDGDRFFQERVKATVIKADTEFDSASRALLMLHLSEKEPLGRKPWIKISSHFLERREALLDTAEHHASIQRIFFQEVMVKFSFDVALRLANTHLFKTKYQKLTMVLACLADHLEDFISRLSQRETVFDEETRTNIPLGPEKRKEVYNHMTELLSVPLMTSLEWALAPRMPKEVVELQNRRCYSLLDEKTRLTAETHDQLEEVQELAYRCVGMAEHSTDILHHLVAELLIVECQRFLRLDDLKNLRKRLAACRQTIPGGIELSQTLTFRSSRTTRGAVAFM